MDNLISRQAAIDLVRDVCDAILTGCGSHYDGEDEVYDDLLEVDAILKCNKEIGIALRNMQSAQPEIIRCNSCKHWTQAIGKMRGFGLGRCDFHDAEYVTCNGFCYWAERREEGENQ